TADTKSSDNTQSDIREKIEALRNEVAEREQGLKGKTYQMTAIGAALGAGAGAAAATALSTFYPVSMAMIQGGALGAMGGSAFADYVTTKEQSKLTTDKKLLAGVTEGKAYWGSGYRDEVLKEGYVTPPPVFAAGAKPPPKGLA
ncbi:MAG: hypothetical protein JO089_00190, partial [Alphaproteobacteria bacterium]|nr:hypothetical protein [Alphaproteobacteria bacterium]